MQKTKREWGNNAADEKRHLRPGGWIEFGDIQPTLHSTSTPHLTRFLSLLTDTLSPRYSWTPHVTTSLPSLLASQGFISVCTRREKLPLGKHASDTTREREVGLYMQDVFGGLVEAVLARRRELGLEAEEARLLAEGVGAEMEDTSVGGHLWWCSVWAQRPP